MDDCGRPVAWRVQPALGGKTGSEGSVGQRLPELEDELCSWGGSAGSRCPVRDVLDGMDWSVFVHGWPVYVATGSGSPA